MKKIVFSLLLLFGLLPFIQSQTVDSIKVEQAGNLIKVHYKILNSKPGEVFRVTVLCSINGGLQSVIKSLSGDFGDNVVGGRSDYMVLWDVLKDVDEVKSVDFSVRAELLKDNTINVSKKDRTEKKFYAQILGEGPPGIPRLRFGYSGKWGLSARYSVGKDKATNRNVFHTSLDLTRRIVNQKTFQMHLFAGIGDSKLRLRPENGDGSDYVQEFVPGVDVGLLMNAGIFSTSIQCTYFGDLKRVPIGYKIDHYYVGVGLGLRF